VAVDISKFVRSSELRPHVTFIYGVPGIGKTTFASFAPAPVFLMTEDGLMSPHLRKAQFLAAKGHKIQSYDEMLGWLEALAEGDHNFKTVIIDTISAFEPLLETAVLERYNATAKKRVQSVSDIPYGQGPDLANEFWLRFMRACQAVRDNAGMSVIIVGHSVSRQVKPPDSEPYDRYEPALHKKCWPLIIAESDNVFFARRPVALKKEEGGFVEKHRAIAQEDRRLFCEDAATHVAKNRCDLPAYIPMNWAEYAEKVPFMTTEKQETSK